MSINLNSIRDILNVKDDNISFSNNFYLKRSLGMLILIFSMLLCLMCLVLVLVVGLLLWMSRLLWILIVICLMILRILFYWI